MWTLRELFISLIRMNRADSTVTIAGATGNMPLDLATTSVARFNQQMDRQRDAKDVQLISEKQSLP